MKKYLRPSDFTLALHQNAVRVVCHAESTFRSIAHVCNIFPEGNNRNVEATLSIFDDRMVFDYGSRSRTVMLRADDRNTYPILLSFYYTATLLRGLIPIHSAVIGNRASGALIFGDFGAGKTALSLACVKRGYGLYGGDHSLVSIHAAEVTAVQGSKRAMYDNETVVLGNAVVRTEVPIRKLVHVVGLCSHGIVTEVQIGDPLTRARRIVPHIVWPYFTPLRGDDKSALLDPLGVELAQNAARRLGESAVEMVGVRGDADEYSYRILNF